MYGVGGCGGGGGGGGGWWHCEQNLIKRSFLSGISGVQLLLESLGILIIILILRSNPFQTLHDKGCFTQDRRGGTLKNLAGSMLQDLSNLYPISD